MKEAIVGGSRGERIRVTVKLGLGFGVSDCVREN